jgi:hypothetical protein
VFQFEKKAWMPYPVKDLGDVKKHSVAKFLLFQARGDFINYSINLMNGRVAFAEAKLVGREKC